MTQRQSPISRWCERIIEAGWLLALTLIPIYFNLYSARHFEPDKAATLRSLVLIMAAAGLVRGLEALAARGERAAPAATPAGPGLWRRFTAIPLALPTLVYALVFLLTTITSVVPGTSFWGSYQRMQGTYTNLSYILLFVMIVVTLRSRAQLERIVTVGLAAATAAGAYGIVQHQGLDPLPWQGDVITRVASTMGNSIFVAAYLIMLIPLALYRLFAHLGEARGAPEAGNAGREWLWALARGLFLLSGLLLLLAVIMIGAAVRTIDFRYWWLFPGAVACATALWWLISLPIERGDRAPAWPGLLYLGFLLVFGLQFVLSASAGAQAVSSAAAAPRSALWWLWLLLSVVAGAGGYGLALTLPQLPATPSRLSHTIGALGAGATALLLGLAVFFTQSRGPWIGLGVGLFTFFTLLLLQAGARARARGDANLAGRLRGLLIGWVGVALAAGIFLVAFNISDAPFFQRLREVPYLGRMGQLLEVDSGTGLVRRLIWTGDEHAGGAVGLITSDPLRTVIGWGPESMFVAFNPFYPPSLANVEARGASPDRSHQAILDELVTKGLLGLASYLFLLGSFVVLAWRLMRRSDEWRWQLFFIATLSAVVAHFVEGLTGIPIVSTLMMLWVLLAITVVGGALAGHYRLSLAPAEPAPAEPAPAEAVPAPTGSKQAGQRRKGQPARGQAARGAGPRRSARQRSSPGALAAYALLGLITFALVWWFNLQPVYADMRFQQGQGLSERPGLSLDGLLQALDDYLATIRSNPREDFYYLNLGRSLMTLADNLRLSGAALGEPGTPDVDDLLRLQGPEQIVGFVQRSSPMELMGYAEAVLLRAHELNPLNKDHFANLGRLNSFWFGWTEDPARLQTAADWYARVGQIAPQDVTLINERAGVVTQLANYAARNGDAAKAAEHYAEARSLLERSAELDPRYADTFMRLGDLQRTADGDPEAAIESYLRAVDLAAHTTAGSVEAIAADLADRPDLLLKLRDGYAAAATRAEENLRAAEGQPERAASLPILRERAALLHSVVGLLTVRGGELPAALEPYKRAVELLPANSSYSRNYTIVLSDTRQYDAAIAEVNRLLAQLRAAGRSDEAAQAEALIPLLEQARQ